MELWARRQDVKSTQHDGRRYRLRLLCSIPLFCDVSAFSTLLLTVTSPNTYSIVDTHRKEEIVRCSKAWNASASRAC